jgi:hypothetical protein
MLGRQKSEAQRGDNQESAVVGGGGDDEDMPLEACAR